MTPQLTSQETEALKGLADIVAPELVSWLPQTWGWAALGVLVLAAAGWGLWRWHRRQEANRYRAEALDELARIQSTAEIAPLIKRVALAAWPRDSVAALSGAQWVAFLKLDGTLAELLNDAEYSGAPVSKEKARAAAMRWIKEHRVSA